MKTTADLLKWYWNVKKIFGSIDMGASMTKNGKGKFYYSIYNESGKEIGKSEEWYDSPESAESALLTQLSLIQ